MRISTLSIGDELICGRIVDTNAAAIAAGLLEHGLHVQRHMIVGDNEIDIIDALAELERVSDYIVATGGLGPTLDDMTTHAVARATGRRLVVNEAAQEHIRKITGCLSPEVVSQLSDKQAMLPSKTTVIDNPVGTACGFHLMHNNCFMFFMPGVPGEMVRMLHESVLPFIVQRLPRRRVIRTQSLNLFGKGEPEVDHLLSGLARPDRSLVVGVCVSHPVIKVTLQSECDTAQEAERLLDLALQEARRRLGDVVYSLGDESYIACLARLLIERRMTVALAESCTGGMLAGMLTSLAGSSAYFVEGAVTYSNSAKVRQLGVPVELIEAHGAVSSQVAAAMAEGIRRLSAAGIGVSLTGIAGPDGAVDGKPVGTVYIALATADGCRAERFQFSGNRERVRTMAAWVAMERIRKYLLENGPVSG